MASIFEGVPFIINLPGQRPPINHAANMAVGAQIGIASRRAGQEDRELSLRESYMKAQESQRDAQSKLLKARVDALANETSDQALMNEFLPKMYEDPTAFETPPPFKTFNALENWEKSRALLEQRKLGIDRVKIAQDVDKRINALPDKTQSAHIIARRLKEGLSEGVMAELGRQEALNPLVEGLSPNANTLLYAGDLRKKAGELKASGSTTEAARLIEQATMLEASAQKGQMSITTNPDGTVTVMQGAAGAGALGKQSLERQLGVRESMSTMIDLRDRLRPEDLGVGGVVGEFLDKTLPQFGLSTPDPVRTENRTKLYNLVASMVKQVSPDNRFTEGDQKRVQRVMPSTGVLENYQHASQMLDTMIDVFAERTVRTSLEDAANDRQRARVDLIKRGTTLNDYEVKKAYEHGLLTREDAYGIIAARNASGPVVIPLQQP